MQKAKLCEMQLQKYINISLLNSEREICFEENWYKNNIFFINHF